MTRYDLAAIVLACAWTGFVLCTRNGRRAVYVGRHRFAAARIQWRGRLAPAVRGCLSWPAGQMPRHGPHDELGEVAAWLDELREPAAASAPGDGPVLVATPSGAGPLLLRRDDGVIEVDGGEITVRPSTDVTGALSPYPPPTEPQPRLDEPLPLASRYVAAPVWEPYEPSVDVIA